MQHHYKAEIEWTGNLGTGTSSYTEYERSHIVRIQNKPDLLCSSDIPFRGDGSKHNPEDMLLMALSSCHMLWYLHLCADAGIVVTSYVDKPSGILEVHQGKGKFIEVILNPEVCIANKEHRILAASLHEKAHEYCFIANSVNFLVSTNGIIT
jgi:organic hydroperoxide reductase OsmC/OhrA